MLCSQMISNARERPIYDSFACSQGRVNKSNISYHLHTEYLFHSCNHLYLQVVLFGLGVDLCCA